MGLKVINNSPDKADMTEQGAFATLEYKGDLAYGSDSTLLIDIIDENKDLTHLQVLPTCGCTVADINRADNVYSVKIVYDTKRRGSFTKQIQVPFKEKGSTKKNFITIKGRVI